MSARVTHMTSEEVFALADDAAQAAVAFIQDRVGQTDGGLAALHFSGERWDLLVDTLCAYIRTEINFARADAEEDA